DEGGIQLLLQLVDARGIGPRRVALGAQLGARRNDLANDVLFLGLFLGGRAADDVALKGGEVDLPQVGEPPFRRRERAGGVRLRRQRQREAGPGAGAVLELPARLGRRRRVGGDAIDPRDGVLVRALRLVEARQLAQRVPGAHVRTPAQVLALHDIGDAARRLRARERGGVVPGAVLREREAEPGAARLLVLAL